MNYSHLFRNSSENLSYLYQSVENHIRSLPEGELRVYHRQKNRNDYIDFLCILPEGKRLYIKNNQDLVRKLALKMFLEKELVRIQGLIHACNSAAEEAETLSIASILQEIPEDVHPYIPFDCGKNSIKTKDTVNRSRMEAWKNEPYQGNSHYKNARKHRTSDGTLVKSKSELIIYEKLLQYGITFKYEAPIKIGNITYYPDFTIMLPDGRIIYWEHAGLMNSPRYIMRHKEKMAAYESVDIVPWKNLIVTYDDENENLDIRIVESEIKNKLLV